MARYFFPVGPKGDAVSQKVGKLDAFYADGVLTLEYNGIPTFRGRVKEDTLYEVHCVKEKVIVKEAVPPEDDDLRNVLWWLCGAPPEARCLSVDAYNAKIARYSLQHGKKKYEHGEETKGGYKIYWTKKPTPYARRYFVAFMLSKDITGDEIRELIPFMKEQGYPLEYIREVLQKTWGISP